MKSSASLLDESRFANPDQHGISEQRKPLHSRIDERRKIKIAQDEALARMPSHLWDFHICLFYLLDMSGSRHPVPERIFLLVLHLILSQFHFLFSHGSPQEEDAHVEDRNHSYPLPHCGIARIVSRIASPSHLIMHP